MTNNLQLNVVDGYWNLNEKPLRVCSFAKKQLFSHYLKMKRLKQPIADNPNFKYRPNEVKANFNYQFGEKRELINNFPDISKITFERK